MRPRNIWPCIGLAGWALWMCVNPWYRRRWCADALKSVNELNRYDNWMGLPKKGA